MSAYRALRTAQSVTVCRSGLEVEAELQRHNRGKLLGSCLLCLGTCRKSVECVGVQGCTVCKNNHYLHQGHCFPLAA